jgi:two-component system response regulator RegX3
MQYDCLIVDDEEALSVATRDYFNMFDVSTAWASSGAAADTFLKENTAELILLDINLGDGSGFDLCRNLRKTLSIPILFISARQSDDDMLLALNIGGDDYIAKPYSLSVLLAKVKAVLKRYRRSATGMGTPLVIDYGLRQAYLHGNSLELKTMEYKLLCYFVENPGKVLTKDELFQKVWEDAITGDNTLNVHIRRLRQKLEKDPNRPEYIRTVWGVGYVFSPQQPESAAE